MADARGELSADAAAITAPVRVTPGDDGTVVFERRKSVVVGEDLADARGELGGNGG